MFILFTGMGIAMSSTCNSTALNVPVAYYDEIKDLPNHREKLLVDVREPSELQNTGRIPMSINVPCKIVTEFINERKKKKILKKMSFPVGDVQKAFSNETTDEQFSKSYNHPKPNMKDQIIVSCQSGKRSQIAAETLVNLGYKQLVVT